jgi:hypothetical protein
VVSMRRDATTPERLEEWATKLLAWPEGDVRVANCFGRAARYMRLAEKAKHPIHRQWEQRWALNEISNAIGWASR